MAVCEACGQPITVAEPPADELSQPAEGLLALLTDDERARGARAMHELSPARQQAVKAALKTKS